MRFVLSVILILTAQTASAECFLGLPFLCSAPRHHYRHHRHKVVKKVIIQKKIIIQKKVITEYQKGPLVW